MRKIMMTMVVVVMTVTVLIVTDYKQRIKVLWSVVRSNRNWDCFEKY